MKSYCLMAAFFAAILCFSFSSHAVIINVVPNALSVEQGDSVNIDITASDLGNGVAPSVGVFDLDFSYDASVLSFNNATFGNQLDLFGFGSSQLVDSNIAGSINLFELSFDLPSDLDTLQTPSFVLVSLVFDTLATGSTNLNIGVNSFGDSLGIDLSPSIVNSSLVVINNPVAPASSPEPIWLILLGIAMIGFANKKKWQ